MNWDQIQGSWNDLKRRPQLPYADRRAAGKALAEVLKDHVPEDGLLVLALPRGGVPVGFEVARRLDTVLDVMVVRKLGVPGQPEVAMGAVASGGVCEMNREIERRLPPIIVDQVIERESRALHQYEQQLRGDCPLPEVRGTHVVLVDDGVATGATMRAALRATRSLGAASITVAVPIGSPESIERLESECHRVICPLVPSVFVAVSQWYRDFGQVSTEEVRRLLDERACERHQPN